MELLGRVCASLSGRVLMWCCAPCAQAIEFVQMQRDDELWELLITFALGSADLTGMLADCYRLATLPF